MSFEPDRSLDRLLPRQFGAFSRRQVEAAGFTARMVDYRLAHRQWRVIDNSVYGHSAYAVTWEQRAMAALLAEPIAVLGGKTAAAVYELTNFPRGAIHITVPPNAAHRTRIARVRRSPLIEPHGVNGLRANSMALVLIELAACVSTDRLDRALEEAVLRGLTSMEAMTEWYVRLAKSRRPGIAKLRAIINRRGSGFVPAESELEAMLFAALDHPAIPPVSRQSPFPWSVDEPSRVDGFIEQWGILLEADGRRWHARLDSMDADRRRDQEAMRRGYIPLRFGWVDLRDGPERVRQVVIDAGQRPPRRDIGQTRTKARPTMVLSGTGPM